MGVFGGMVVGVLMRELRAEMLDLLLGQLQGALGLFVLFLLAGKCFGAFCPPRLLPLFFGEDPPGFVDACEMLVEFLPHFPHAFGILRVTVDSVRLDGLVWKVMRLPPWLQIL